MPMPGARPVAASIMEPEVAKKLVEAFASRDLNAAKNLLNFNGTTSTTAPTFTPSPSNSFDTAFNLYSAIQRYDEAHKNLTAKGKTLPFVESDLPFDSPPLKDAWIAELYKSFRAIASADQKTLGELRKDGSGAGIDGDLASRLLLGEPFSQDATERFTRITEAFNEAAVLLEGQTPGKFIEMRAVFDRAHLKALEAQQ